MPSSKTKFSCGHRGFGSVCHRCQDATRIEAEVAKLKTPTRTRKQELSAEAKAQDKAQSDLHDKLEFEAAALRSTLPRTEFRKEWNKARGVQEPKPVAFDPSPLDPEHQ
jgi:hypothetical protein